MISAENTLATSLFLIVGSITILFYEWVIPLAMIAAGFKMLYISYKHQKYANPPPNVTNNINFIGQFSQLVIQSRYFVDLFIVEVIYW